jgi:hypothetical protein
MLGSFIHSDLRKSVTERANHARLSLDGFKTNVLMLSDFNRRGDYHIAANRLEVESVLKGAGGCIAGRATPRNRDLIAWLDTNRSQSTQPHAALIGALTKDGADPVDLKVTKAWDDLWSDWGDRNAVWVPRSLADVGPVLGAYFNFLIDVIQLSIRTVYGFASDFGLRPVKSALIAFIIVAVIWGWSTFRHGRVAYLAVPIEHVDTRTRTVPLAILKKHMDQWQVVTFPRVAGMMIPRAITSVPLLGDFFENATFDWNGQTIVGFRRAARLEEFERRDNQNPISAAAEARWALVDDNSPDQIAVPKPRRLLGNPRQSWQALMQRLRELTRHDAPKHLSESATADAGMVRYFPGWVGSEDSDTLLGSLRRWRIYGLVAAVALASGIAALLKF